MSSVSMYARQLASITYQLGVILTEARTDKQLTQHEREDVTWTIRKLRENAADAAAELAAKEGRA